MEDPEPHRLTGGPSSRVVERLRFVMAPACLAVGVLAAVVMVWSMAKGVSLVDHLLEKDGWKKDTRVGELLEVLDLLLIGAVLVILAVGLWQTFVGDLAVPESMDVSDLTSLKRKISDVLILVIAVQFTKLLLAGTIGLDLLYTGAGIALVGTMLVFYARPGGSTGKPND